MRIYDARLVRFLSVDPLIQEYPELTPYQFASNCPITGIDRDGLEFTLPILNGIEAILQHPVTKEIAENLRKLFRPTPVPGTRPIPIPIPIPLPIPSERPDAKPLEEPGTVPSNKPDPSNSPNRFPKIPTPSPGPGQLAPMPESGTGTKPGVKPGPGNISSPNPAPEPESDDDQYITLYRGVGPKVDPFSMYRFAKSKIAMPRALLPEFGHSMKYPFANPDQHVFGEQNTMYTSWSLHYDRAKDFAVKGSSIGIVLTKKFKLSELVRSIYSDMYFFRDGEYLKFGPVVADKMEYVKPNK